MRTKTPANRAMLKALFIPGGRRVVPGRSIGPYLLLEKLGAGGMGEMYLADDTRLGRKVALKTLLDTDI